jgi:hypothetical protein
MRENGEIVSQPKKKNVHYILSHNIEKGSNIEFHLSFRRFMTLFHFIEYSLHLLILFLLPICIIMSLMGPTTSTTSTTLTEDTDDHATAVTVASAPSPHPGPGPAAAAAAAAASASAAVAASAVAVCLTETKDDIRATYAVKWEAEQNELLSKLIIKDVIEFDHGIGDNPYCSNTKKKSTKQSKRKEAAAAAAEAAAAAAVQNLSITPTHDEATTQQSDTKQGKCTFQTLILKWLLQAQPGRACVGWTRLSG